MGLPRFSGIDKIVGMGQSFDNYLLQIHNLYPNLPDDFFKYFEKAFNFTIKELIRIDENGEPIYEDYIQRIIDELGIEAGGEISVEALFTMIREGFDTTFDVASYIAILQEVQDYWFAEMDYMPAFFNVDLIINLLNLIETETDNNLILNSGQYKAQWETKMTAIIAILTNSVNTHYEGGDNFNDDSFEENIISPLMQFCLDIIGWVKELHEDKFPYYSERFAETAIALFGEETEEPEPEEPDEPLSYKYNENVFYIPYIIRPV